MKLIYQPREDDQLATFGELLRFAALIYDGEAEADHEANSPFEPYSIDGDVVFPLDRAQADTVFDAWVEALKAAEQQFLDEWEEEGFVALFDSPNKGLMIIAGSNIMGYEGPDADLYANAKSYEGMPHVTWERILEDMWDES